MCALTIVASDFENTDNKVEETIKIKGRFPCVVCFYRTEKQRESYFGKKEGEGYVPPFGFDMYAPYLYGVNQKVLTEYPVSPYIMTAYTASILKDKKKNEIIERTIRLYPTDREWIKDDLIEIKEKDKEGDKYVPLPKDKIEYKYHPSWLYPKVARIELFCKISFPKKEFLTDGDDFIEYKKKPQSDEETIFFKLVKVDKDWNPIRVSTWDDKKKERKYRDFEYVGINEAEPVDEKEKADIENKLNTKKQELQDLIAEKERLTADSNAKEAKIKENNEPYTQKEAQQKADDYKAKNNEEYQKEQRQNPNHDKEALRKKYKDKYDNEFDRIQTEFNTHDKNGTHPDRPNAKAENEVLKREKDEIEKQAKIKDKEIAQKRKEVAEYQKKYDTDFYFPTDDNLTLSTNSHTYPFRNDRDKDKEFAVSINRTGESELNSALIAYYKRTDNGIEKEYIIGQLNILAYNYYKSSDLLYDEYSLETKFPIYFKKLPISFMKINIADEKGKVKDWNFNKNIGLSNDALIGEINKYFAQTGIEFIPNGEFDTMTWNKKSDTEMEIGGIIFNLEKKENSEIRLLKTENGKKKLDDVLKDEYAKYILQSVLYETGSDPINSSDIQKGKFPKLGKRYKKFTEEYLQLYKNRNKSLDGEKSETKISEKTAYYNVAKSIANYLADRNIVVFLINDITGGTDSKSGDTGLHTAAYTYLNHNRVFMFGSALGKDKVVDTLVHELGHSLGLQHTFNKDYMMFPEKVGFTDEKWVENIKEDNIKDGDYKGYGATYDNIMDYGKDSGSKNGDFIRRSFTKKQWLKMTEAIVRNSKAVFDHFDTDYKIFNYLDEEKID